jgi:hypothetical protein
MVPIGRSRADPLIQGTVETLMTMCTIVLITAMAMTTAVQAKMPVPKHGTCPSRYYQSGGFCVPIAQAPSAIPKHGPCPRGWAQGGEYCFKMRRGR